MHDDHALLQRYAHEGDEAAFAELVQRHVNLVWGAAQRITQDADLAKDIVQTVFVDLARKSGRLPPGTIVVGWLYRSSTHAAHSAVRSNTRRIRRENLAMTDPTSTPVPETDAAVALQLIVDQAIEALPDSDRNVVLLRFFSGKNFAEIGALLGISDDAAQKRVSRALDKIRAHFEQRGVNVSHSVVSASLGLAAAHVAPTGAVTFFSATAFAAAASHTILGVLSTMKTSLIIVGSAAAVLVSTAVAVVEYRKISALRAENAALRVENGALIGRRATTGTDIAAPGVAGDVLTDRSDLGNSIVRNLPLGANNKNNDGMAPKRQNGNQPARLTQLANNLKMIGLAARIYSTDHGEKFPTTFEEMRGELALNPGDVFSDGTPLSLFEFFPQPRPISEQEPTLILSRLKDPVSLGGNSWAKLYCYTDGSVTTRKQVGTDFTEFEREGTASLSTLPVDAASKRGTVQNGNDNAARRFMMDPILARCYGLAPGGADPKSRVIESKAPKAKGVPIAMDPVLAKRYGLIVPVQPTAVDAANEQSVNLPLPPSAPKSSKQAVELDPPQDAPK